MQSRAQRQLLQQLNTVLRPNICRLSNQLFRVATQLQEATLFAYHAEALISTLSSYSLPLVATKKTGRL